MCGHLIFNMSLVIATSPITTAGTKQFGDLPIIFSGYQVKDTLINNKLYADNSSAFPSTVVGTAVLTTRTSNSPLAGNLFETLYSPSNSNALIPLVGQKRDYLNINASVSNSGARWAVSWNMSFDNWATLVIRSTGTSIAGKLRFRSSVGNETTCSFTTSSVANTWTNINRFDFKTNAATGVVFTGAPVFSDITAVEITLDAISQVDVAMIYGVNNYSQIIGERIAYKHACVSEANFENTLEMSELLCNQLVEQKTGSGRAVSITVGSKKKDIEAQSIGLGDIIKIKQGSFIDVINDENIGRRVVTAGAITLVAGLNIALVEIDGIGTLKPFHSATTVPEGAYFYTGTTFTTNPLYNGRIVRIYIWNTTNKATREIKALEMGFVGFLQMPRRTESGKYEYITTRKAQVTLQTEGFNDDFDQVNFMYDIYPQNGSYVEIATDL